MTILNLMLGKERGGLEQAALDYAEALALAQIPARTVISPGAWVEAPLVAAQVAHESLTNRGRWDMLAPLRLQAMASRTQAQAIICHGNRALTLALRAFGRRGARPDIIAVAHNYSTRRFARADRCFAITQHLATHLEAGGARHITPMPNMVRIHPPTPRPEWRTPPVIGSMGRFVAKKGFATYIEALALLRTRGVPFRAVLGGDGDGAAEIDALIARHQLGDQLQRIGWVKDKTAFFDSIDLFALPSLHEPFGIVLIEAMSHSVPTLSTDAEGPSEILRPGENGLLVPKHNPAAMAEALAQLLTDPARATSLGASARHHVATHYSMEAMAHRLTAALGQQRASA